MLIRLDPSDTRPIYVQIMDEIRRGIVMGVVEPDSALPSVRQLAGELRVNPNTVQQAYRELEREGVIYVRRGQGTFVAPSVRADRSGLARDVAKRALREARRNGLSVDEFLKAIRKAAAEEDEESVLAPPAAKHGGNR
ncbi:MAG TPA: GntR family transcriptional regulator, partial [Longimicrobiales bacterium]